MILAIMNELTTQGVGNAAVGNLSFPTGKLKITFQWELFVHNSSLLLVKEEKRLRNNVYQRYNIGLFFNILKKLTCFSKSVSVFFMLVAVRVYIVSK